MKDIIIFLFFTKKVTEKLITKTSKYKRWLALILLISNWVILCVHNYVIYNITFLNLLFFIYHILYIFIFTVIIWLIWKLFWWKSSYLNIFVFSLLSFSIIIVYNIILIILYIFWISLVWTFFWFWLSIIVWLPLLIWFLYIWSKSLSIIQKVSETKITFIVILSLFILVIMESFLSKLIWINTF